MLPRKIQCLSRLLDLTKCLPELLDYLVDEKVITPEQKFVVQRESDQASALHVLLEDARKTERLLLLDYEWTVLPVERIRLILVSERNQRVFSYNYA